MNTVDLELSEAARRAGECQAEAWWPVFVRWAVNHANDPEITHHAAFCDGFRACLKIVNVLEPHAVARMLDEDVNPRGAGRKSHAERLAAADLAQDLTRP